MFAFLTGEWPVSSVRAAGLLFVAVAAIGQAGCAANSNAYYASSPAVADYVAVGPAVHMEDDGLPSQAAPSPRVRQMPDDPSEPYSRNYGGPNPAARPPARPMAKAQTAASKPLIPADLPPDFRRQLVAAIATAE